MFLASPGGVVQTAARVSSWSVRRLERARRALGRDVPGRPLLLTSAVRDDRYQRLPTTINPAATRAYSMHTTGYAFDIRRSFSSVAQKRAFFRLLAKLQAANAIAYIPELAATHIAVASDAPAELALLRRLT